MAKSFHKTLADDRNFEVDHMGETVNFTLPDFMPRDLTTFEACKAYTDELSQEEFMGAVHDAVAQRIIKIRAKGRPPVKKFDNEDKFNAYIATLINKENYHINVKQVKDGDDKRFLSAEVSLKLSADTEAQNRMDIATFQPTPVTSQGKEAAKKQILYDKLIAEGFDHDKATMIVTATFS